MAALAEAFVRIRPDTHGFREETRRDIDRAGSDSGDNFGKRFNAAFGNALRGSGGIGDLAGRVISLITPSLGGLASGFNLVAGSAAGLTASLGKLAVGAAAMSTLAAATASAAASMVSLAGAIAPASGLIAALPGLVAGVVAVNTVLKLSLYSVGDAMKAAYEGDMKKFDAAMLKLTSTAQAFAAEFLATVPAMKEFQQAAQDGFFSELNGSLAHFVDLLRGTQPWIQALATNLGSVVREFLLWATAAESVDKFNRILGNTSGLVTSIRLALQPVLTGFLDLAVVGSDFFGGFRNGIADSLTRFGEWLSEVSRSGQAMEWMNTGLAVLKQLGEVAQQVGGIFEAVFRAAGEAGGDALGGLVGLLRNINAALSDSEGQAALVAIFKSLQEVGKALGPVIKALISGLGEVAPAVADIAVAFGPVLTSAIRALAPAIAALAPGIIAVIGGIGAAVQALGPSLVPIGQAIGAAFASLAPVFAAIGSAIATLVPQIASVVAAFAPVVATLINALAPAIAALAPGLIAVGNALATAFANPAVSEALLALGMGISNLLIAVAPLIPPLIELAAILVERLGTGLTALALVLAPVISALADALAPILPEIARLFSEVSAVLLPVAQQFGNELAGALRDLMPHVQPIMDALREVGGQILTAIRDVLPEILPHLGDLARAFKDVFIEVAKVLPDLIKFAGTIVVELIKQLPVLIPMVLNLALAFLDILKQITPLIPPLLKLLLDVVLPLIPELPKLLPPLISLVTLFSDLLREVSPLLKKLLESETVANIVKIGAANMVLAFNLVKDAVNFAIGAAQTFIGVFFGLPGQVDQGLGRMGEAIKGWANSVIGWFESIINIIASGVPGMGQVQFPRLANGAIVDRATMAMIGEAGREVVIPLTRPRRAVELAEQSGLTDLLAKSFRVPDLSARPLALAGASAVPAAAAGPGWDDRPLIGTYVAAPGQSPQRLMSDLRVEAIGANW
ncbi:hypothetical protein AB0J28_00685 [Streptosporangium canum]|uniref:hypothetical protein n=1 Tax=Streptosporangium canum TaxID=324952 RepID=UPI00343BF57B